MARTRRNIIKSLVLGLLASILLTLGMMLLLAAALIYLHLGDQLLTVLNQLMKLICIVLGVWIAVPRGGDRGLATGVLLALAYMALGYALYVLLGGGSFAVGNMLGEMLLGCAAGAVAGAIRANLPAGRRKRPAHS